MKLEQITLRVLALGTLIGLFQQLSVITKAFEKYFDDTYPIKELWVTYDNLTILCVLFVLFCLPLLVGVVRWGKILQNCERKIYVLISWAEPLLGFSGLVLSILHVH